MTKRNGNIESEANRVEEFLSHVPEDLDPNKRSDLVDTWNLAGSVLTNDPIDEDLKSTVREYVFSLLEKRSSSTHLGQVVLLQSRTALRLVTHRFTAVAASLLLLVGMSFILAPDIHTVRAPRGSVEAVSFTLPDGSTGYLSAGSELRYSDTFGKRVRTVALKGEAMFDVTKDGSPFFVNTYNTRVAVLGTSFSVRAWASDIAPETIVKVREGKVAVSRRYVRSQGVNLEPAQQINVRPQLPVLTESVKPTSEHSFNWLSGGVDFVNMPIGSVINELSRRFDVRLDAPMSVRDRRITLLPSDKASLEDVLVDISAALSIRYRKIAGGYEFYLD